MSLTTFYPHGQKQNSTKALAPVLLDSDRQRRAKLLNRPQNSPCHDLTHGCLDCHNSRPRIPFVKKTGPLHDISLNAGNLHHKLEELGRSRNLRPMWE